MRLFTRKGFLIFDQSVVDLACLQIYDPYGFDQSDLDPACFQINDPYRFDQSVVDATCL